MAEERTSQKRYARTGLAVICTAAFMVPFMGSALNLALPTIGADFSMKAVSLTWMATAYLISTAIFQIPFARLADLVGRKKIFMSGLAVFTLCTLLCGFAWSGGLLIVLRFFSGIGSAMMMGTNIAIITSLFPPEERGKALGINSATVYAALAAGPIIGGFLTDYLGWHSIFFVAAGAGLVVLVMARFFLKGEWIEARGERFDLWGTVLYGVGLAALIYGFTSLPSVVGIISLCTGVIAFMLFGRFELRHKYPVFNLRLFSGNKVFTFSSLAALINYAATSGLGFMMSLYLQIVRGLDARHAGLVLISQACIQSVFSLFSGYISERVEPSRLATAGMCLTVLGLTGMVFVDGTTPFWMIIGLLMVLGVGFGIFSAPNTNVIMGSVSKKDYSQASAVTGTMRLTGQAFSMGIAGMAVSLHIGERPVTTAVSGEFLLSMRLALIIFVVLCIVGVWFSTARVKAAGRTDK